LTTLPWVCYYLCVKCNTSMDSLCRMKRLRMHRYFLSFSTIPYLGNDQS
jgi:hypothetical protein